jgi:DUF1365 family protein
MAMDMSYDWRFLSPGKRLAVHMQNAKHKQKLFDATLELERTEISGPALARVLVTYPLMTLKVIAAIYWQAFRLWLKRVPVYDHPAKASTVHEKRT